MRVEQAAEVDANALNALVEALELKRREEEGERATGSNSNR
jgi:hypothetical protein